MIMKKNHIWIISAIALLLISTLACRISFGEFGVGTVKGSGEVVTAVRSVSGFNRIDLSGLGQLFIEVGEEEALDIEAEDNLLKYIETEVSGDTLTIGIKSGTSIQPTREINYYLTVVDLESISVSGAGNVQTAELTSTNFSIRISGAGNIEIDRLDANNLDVSISGLGNLDINGGQVETQDVDISGSGNHDAVEMESSEASINLSGLGGATVWVTGKLDADISGAGSVKYKGNPSVTSDVSGLGSINNIGK
jgi:hypothetical protein